METNFKYLNQIIDLDIPKLIVLGARPLMGKTILALNIATDICITGNTPTLIFSLETSKSSLIRNIISSLSEIDNSAIRKDLAPNKDFKIKNSELNDIDWERLVTIYEKLSKSELYIEDTHKIDVDYIVEKCRELKSKVNLKFVVIDYLQLILFNNRTVNTSEELEKIFVQLSNLVKDLDITILLTSQLSHNIEERNDNRPTLSDFTLSKDVINYADIIMFLYRDEYYNFESKEKNIAELIVAKNKNEKPQILKLKFEAKYSRFK